MTRAFTIGIDIRVLGSGRQSGIEHYILNLLPEIIRLAPDIKFKLFFSSFREAKLSYAWMQKNNVELYRFFYSNRLMFVGAKLVGRPCLDKLIGGVDVFFSPHFLLAPLGKRCKLVTTFHDLSFVRYPQFFSWQKNIWHRFEMNPRHQAQRSQQVVATSFSTRNDLISLYGIDPGKIRVVYSGLSPLGGSPEATEINRVRTRYQLPENFFLYLGTMEPRKNILGILQAFDYLQTRRLLPDDSHLVIAGERGWRERDIFRFCSRSPWRKLIHLSGVVDEKDKGLVYQLARVFVYPSFFEGFGFPPLEAMQMGVPVVTSRTSSLPEVVGNAALLIDPYNIRDLAEVMQLLFTSEAVREIYRQRGRQRVKLFSWEKSAKETLEVLWKARASQSFSSF